MEELDQKPSSGGKMGAVAQTSGLKGKDYIGYALGDFAGCLCFSTITTLLQKYYTDVLGLTPLFIMIMFIVARVWDAINDPIMGRIVDLRKPDKRGRYRIWMKWVAIPLALATILVFLPGPNIVNFLGGPGGVGIMVYATITYILFGMVYTVHQIPYGSLASVVTTDDKERNKLSVFRSVGAALGSVPVLIITFIWSKQVLDSEGNPVMGENGKPLSQVQHWPIIIGVAVICVLAAVLLFLAYHNNKERVVAKPAPKAEKGETARIVKSLLGNRNFIAVCLIGLLLLAGQMFTQSFYTYLFNDLFNANWMNMVSMVCTYAPMAVLMLFAGKIVRKFGKKNFCAIGGIIAGVANLALVFLKGPVEAVPALFLVFCFISGCGLSVLTLEIWALATDAIDDVEVKTGKRNDGTAYSVFMFFRKLGQVVAAIAVNGALIGMHYKAGPGQIQEMSTLNVMYYMATIIPAVMFGAMGVVALVVYGLGKKKTEELQVAKAKLLEEKAAKGEIDVGENATQD
ncbi:MAG: MFS transporter [Bacilli bacterium]|nr:MFS transporter [Bacilli bacterium]